MTTDYKRIYRHLAAEYDRMVAAEDCDGALLPAIQAVMPTGGARVVEVGVGTARVTRLLAQGGAAAIIGVDESPHMLHIARRHMTREAGPGSGCDWQLLEADSAAIPATEAWADLAIAGWVYGHFTQWFEASWREHLDRSLAELARVTRPGGAHIIIESLGTGVTEPEAPSPALRDYHEHLELAHGFQRRVLRTDYEFPSPAHAARACGFFFGDAFASTILANRWARVPEWTGLWHRSVDA